MILTLFNRCVTVNELLKKQRTDGIPGGNYTEQTLFCDRLIGNCSHVNGAFTMDATNT